MINIFNVASEGEAFTPLVLGPPRVTEVPRQRKGGLSVWTDPEFDPSLDALYYARVPEIPTPRWSTIQAVRLGRVPPDGVALTIQKRACSSPI